MLEHFPSTQSPPLPTPSYCRAWECLISTLYVGRALGKSLPHFQNFSSSKRMGNSNPSLLLTPPLSLVVY